MRGLRRLARLASVALVGFVLVPVMAHAQGSITGVVQDVSGAVLPGVTVEASSPALIEKVRAVITDGSGQYRIVDLRPGTYAVTFTLPGFSVVKQEGVELTGAFTATVNAQLRVGALEETITVTGATPTVDVQSVAQQRVLTKDVIDAVPAGRSHIDLAILIPGLSGTQPGRAGSVADVGGTNNLQITWMSIHGSRQSDMRVMVDGINIRNLANEGNSTNFVPDMGSTQEVTVDYSAGSAELMSGGLRIDHIPREGGNTFRGSIFGTGVNSAFQGSNYSDDLRARGLAQPNALKRSYDVNPSGGGPIVRDRLWFYTSARWQANSSFVAGVYANRNAGNPNAWTYEPDLSDRGVFSLTQSSGNARVTWQASQTNKFNVAYDQQVRNWDDGRANVSPESFTRYKFPLNRILTTGWSSPVTSRLLMEARFANHAEEYYAIYPEAGDPYRTLIPVTEQSTGLLYRGAGVASPTVFQISSAPNINEAKASLSYVTGSHAFKVGFNNLWGDQNNTSRDNDSSVSYRFNNGIPNQITQRATPFKSTARLNSELGVFVQDRWTLKRLTVNAGLRFDYFSTEFPEQSLGPGTLVPNRNLTFARTSWYSFKDLTPRLGVAYDLFGTGRTAVKASLSEFILAGNPAVGNPVSNLALSVTRSWTDTNRNFVPDCVLTDPLANAECGAISDRTFGGLRASTTYDPAILRGWNTRPNNWEFSTSVQHELMPRVAVDVGYFRRWFGNFTVTDNRAVVPADYDPYSITAPGDARLPGGGGYVIPGLFDLNPSKVGLVDNYLTAARNFGKQIEHWNGMDASVNVRPRDGVLLQGGFSTGRTTTDNCDVVARTDNPSQLYCRQQTNFLSQVKFLGTYTVPRVDVRVAATFQSTPGPVVLANYVALNGLIQPSLGRPLSGGAQNVTVNLVAPGTMYGERQNQFDLRFSKMLRFGRARTAVNLDLYNVLNTNAVLAQNNNFATWQVPQRVVEARLVKLSANLDF